MIRVGIISDTHGLLRPEAIAFLQGSEHIIHAGDIGDAPILEALGAIAPVTVVRGNNDLGDWASHLRDVESVCLHGIAIHVVHDLAAWSIERNPNVRVVVSGHSHQPKVEERDGILYVNPGSAGPRRFTLPVSAGEILIDGPVPRARTVLLLPPVAPHPRAQRTSR